MAMAEEGHVDDIEKVASPSPTKGIIIHEAEEVHSAVTGGGSGNNNEAFRMGSITNSVYLSTISRLERLVSKKRRERRKKKLKKKEEDDDDGKDKSDSVEEEEEAKATLEKTQESSLVSEYSAASGKVKGGEEEWGQNELSRTEDTEPRTETELVGEGRQKEDVLGEHFSDADDAGENFKQQPFVFYGASCDGNVLDTCCSRGDCSTDWNCRGDLEEISHGIVIGGQESELFFPFEAEEELTEEEATGNGNPASFRVSSPIFFGTEEEQEEEECKSFLQAHMGAAISAITFRLKGRLRTRDYHNLDLQCYFGILHPVFVS